MAYKTEFVESPTGAAAFAKDPEKTQRSRGGCFVCGSARLSMFLACVQNWSVSKTSLFGLQVPEFPSQLFGQRSTRWTLFFFWITQSEMSHDSLMRDDSLPFLKKEHPLKGLGLGVHLGIKSLLSSSML